MELYGLLMELYGDILKGMIHALTTLVKTTEHYVIYPCPKLIFTNFHYQKHKKSFSLTNMTSNPTALKTCAPYNCKQSWIMMS